MKKILIIFAAVLLTGCNYSPTEPAEITSKKAEVVYFLVSNTEISGAPKIGCDDYLVKRTKSVEAPATIEKALKALYEVGALAPPGPDETGVVYTSTDIGRGYFKLNEASVETGESSIIVDIPTDPAVGLSGICDQPRAQGQIEATIKAQTGGMPYSIKLDGSDRAWRCFGDESGLCT